MSSKFLFLLTFSVIINSCGVKSGPVAPADTLLPSVESFYMDNPEKSQENYEETNAKKQKETKVN